MAEGSISNLANAPTLAITSVGVRALPVASIADAVFSHMAAVDSHTAGISFGPINAVAGRIDPDSKIAAAQLARV